MSTTISTNVGQQSRQPSQPLGQPRDHVILDLLDIMASSIHLTLSSKPVVPPELAAKLAARRRKPPVTTITITAKDEGEVAQP